MRLALRNTCGNLERIRPVPEEVTGAGLMALERWRHRMGQPGQSRGRQAGRLIAGRAAARLRLMAGTGTRAFAAPRRARRIYCRSV